MSKSVIQYTINKQTTKRKNNMTNTTATKLQQLTAIYVEAYKFLRDGDTELAAKFAVEDTMNMFRTQMEHIDSILDIEIEYATKFRNKYATN